ncbi:hypothetical protein SJR90_11765 [Aeromonas caviae]|uniref:hypothetical protein n=1 Tax=Aeromonas caviae TaxID=648 RepID=UPI0029DD55FC|nr:hypothetical protein [Aeromonas caviae]MDX7783014.1 hypothetical protein [Aeromonas caviae]
MAISNKKFRDININDPFFDSLKSDYPEFSEWFSKKGNEEALLSCNDRGMIDGFLYLKIEDEELGNMTPSFGRARRLKLGTVKVDAHGTKLGERFLHKALNFAMSNSIDEIYVTVFDKHAGLISLLQRPEFRFIERARKNAITPNGREGVYFRSRQG